MNGATIASLREELASIYFADVQYWRQEQRPAAKLLGEYQRRQDRMRQDQA